MKHFFLLIALLFCSCLSFAQIRNFRLVKPPTENSVNDQKRKAVVIGMSDYGGDKSLNNTLNDADDMANALNRLGFEVTLLKNNDLQNLRNNLTNWYKSIEKNDMAVFYFAGHGMEVNGENYLVPIGAELNSQTDVQDYTLKVNNVLGNMDEKQVGMKLIILDACRDNPFKRSWSRGSEEKGLAQMSAPTGTYIAFAAAPGYTAEDGGTYGLHNGVFTYYLKQEILKPGLSIDAIFNKVTGDVSTLTGKQQTPFKNSSLAEDFYFIPPNPILIGTDSITAGVTDSLTTLISQLKQKNTSLLTSNHKKNVFAPALGIGARKVNEWGTYLDIGVRWTHNFTPFIGWDVVNINFQGYLSGNFFSDGLFQAMSGVRGYTKNFTKDMKGYASLKVGFGNQSYLNASGFASEFEIGLLFTKNICVGFVYNYQNLQGQLNNSNFSVNCPYAGLRVSYDFNY